MPIAAVPAYLGNDFQDASPGMRFGMYLKLWGIDHRSNALLWTTHDLGYEERGQHRQEREVRYENKGSALADAKRLNDRDRHALSALAARQAALAATVPLADLLRLEATAIAPFTTGLGNEHPLENGFAFLNPYGLPYLPGSGVKGVLRQAARELASGAWGATHGWSAEKNIPLMQGEGNRREPVLDKNKQPVKLSVIDVLFGLESGDGETEHVRGALAFWDVIPQIQGDSLMVEIMTPHQSHYYQQKVNRKTGDSASPHDSGQPNPICFLTVPPGSTFTFFVTCDSAHLKRLAPDLAETDAEHGKPRWQVLLRAAFEHAFAWLGFGAKTAVGYGAMRLANPEENIQVCPYGFVENPSSPAQPPPSQAQGSEEIWPQATLRWDPGRGAVWAECHAQKTGQISGDRTKELLAQLGEEQSTRLKKKKSLPGITVKVQRKGNLVELLEIVS